MAASDTLNGAQADAGEFWLFGYGYVSRRGHNMLPSLDLSWGLHCPS
jgi:hypothetical protein